MENLDTMSQQQQQHPAVHKGLSEMFETILSHLPPHDLLTCRLVGQKWWDVSTEILLKKRHLEVSFLNWMRKTSKPSSKRKQSLQSLNECLKTELSVPFPVVKYEFRQVVQIDQDLLTFFQLQGSQIKNLLIEFSFYTTPSCMGCLGDLLQLCSPTLETLHLRNPRSSLKPTDGSDLYLSKLRHLTMSSRSDEAVWTQILRASPNLLADHSEVYSERGDPFVTSSKLSIIKDLRIQLGSSKSINFMEQLAPARPQIFWLTAQSLVAGSLHMSADMRGRAFRAFNLILESSKQSLQKLHLGLLELVCLDRIRFPQFENLTELCVEDARFVNIPSQNFQFPLTPMRWQNFGQVFAHLTEIRVWMSASYEDDQGPWDLLVSSLRFDLVGEMSRVKKLCLSDGSPTVNSIRGLLTLFPRLECLEMETHHFYEVAQGVWKLSKLKRLELMLPLEGAEVNCWPTLDSAFTGLSEEQVLARRDQTFEQLNENPLPTSADEKSECGEDDPAKKIEQNLSILCLQELTDLDLVFMNNGDHPETLRQPPLLTRVTGQYAFQRMPKLTVRVSRYRYSSPFKIVRSVVEEILPFVELHENVQLCDSDEDEVDVDESESEDDPDLDDEEDDDEDDEFFHETEQDGAGSEEIHENGEGGSLQ